MLLNLVLLIELTIVCAVSATQKILVIHPVYAGSHIIAMRRITDELMLKGYHIRVLRWKESSNIPPLDLPLITETILAVDNRKGSVPFMTRERNATFEFPVALMWDRGLDPLSVFDGGMQAAAAACRALLRDSRLIRELSEARFDLAFVDLIYNECGLALAHHLKLPVVAYWGLSFVSGPAHYTTAFNPPSSMPSLYLPFTDRMSLFQRTVNFLYALANHYVMQVHFHYINQHIRQYIPDTPHPSYLLSNISGLLINSHVVFDYPKQLPPTFFQVGGFHIRDRKPLPPILDEFISSSDGVILFSLGKNFDSKSLPPQVQKSYFEAFGQLENLKVVVKAEDVPEDVPANVLVLPYVPQADILAHPKTVLFMTHCGLHGVMEAIHYGVKMVAVPIFFDQGNVAVRLVDLGVAVELHKSASTEDILHAIIQVTTERSYEENMKRISTNYRNSFENPLERCLWLIEHVLETKGADHLKMSVKDLNFFQYFGIDVLLFLSLYFALVFWLVWRFLKWLGNEVAKLIRKIVDCLRRAKNWFKNKVIQMIENVKNYFRGFRIVKFLFGKSKTK